MKEKQEDIFEKRIRFVAKHYEEGKLDPEKAWQQFSGPRKMKRQIPFRRYLMAAAAVILLLIGIGTLHFRDTNSPEWVWIATGDSEMKDIYLPDSTYISMAANSELIYDSKDYGRDGRAVKMKGKVYFEVARDEARPFSVQSELAEVKVLGTSFQINEKSSRVELDVYSGKVGFTAGQEEQAILTAGMSAIYDTENPDITLSTEDNMNSLSWKTKQLQFQNTPIEIVIADLCEHYHINIMNKRGSEDRQLTATFRDLPLNEVLEVINQTLDVCLVTIPNN